MTLLEYKVIAKKESPLKNRNILFDGRLHRVSSKKNGSTEDKFLKDFLEIIDVLTLPVGYVEANCEWMLKQYYKTNGKEGWSQNEVIDFLLKLKRKNAFVLEFVSRIELESKGKIGVD